MSNTQNYDDETRQDNFGSGNIAARQGDYDTSGGLGSQQAEGYDDSTTGSGTRGLDDFGGQKQRTQFGRGGSDRDTASGGNMGSGVSGGDYDAPIAQDDFSSGPGGGGGQYPSGVGAGQYSSGAGAGHSTRRDDDDDFDSPQRQQQGQKPGMGARVMGGLEKSAGKIMRDPEMEARGQERKTGNQF